MTPAEKVGVEVLEDQLLKATVAFFVALGVIVILMVALTTARHQQRGLTKQPTELRAP